MPEDCCNNGSNNQIWNIMDKHKVDKSIKDFFDKRTIEPNSQIWDRLDAILEVTDDKVNQKSKYFWQGLAASIVFVLSMSLLIYYSNKSNEVPNNPVVVKENSVIQPHVASQNDNQVEISESDPAPLMLIKNKVASKGSHLKKLETLALENVEIVNKPNVAPQYETEALIVDATIEPMDISSQMLLNQVESKPSKNKSDESMKPNPLKLLAQVEAKTNKTYLQKMVKTLQFNAENLVANFNNRNYTD